MAKSDILGHVPTALRAKVPNYESILPVVLTPLLLEETKDLTQILGFIAGAIEFQRLSDDESSKSFKGTILRVEEIERKANGKLLGKKAKIIFEAGGQNGKVTEQTIDTGWTEYHGYNPHEETFNVALANTIVDIAEENIGKDCFIRKVMITGVDTASGGDKVRFIGDLTPADGSKSQKSSGGASTQAKTRGGKQEESKDDEDEDLTVAGFKAEAKKQKVDVTAFKKDDVEEILEAIEDEDAKVVAEIIADVLDVKVKDILKIVDVDDFDEFPLEVTVSACL